MITCRNAILFIRGLLFDLLYHGRFKADGCVFEVPKTLTSRFLRGCCFENTYEINERTAVQKFIRPEDSVIELGACLGIVSCTTNKRLRDPTRHLAVEANPKCIPALRKNRDLNDCAFQIENCAVGNEKQATLFLDPAMILWATTKNRSAFPVTVTGRSLADLYRQHGPFSTLIMDIQGSELDVLETATELLPRFRLVVAELHPWIIGTEGVNRCCTILQQSGFTLAERIHHNEVWLRT
jgi:FkbM family methyltransferase